MTYSPGPWATSKFDPLYVNDADGVHVGKALVIKGLTAKDRMAIMRSNAKLMSLGPEMFAALHYIHMMLTEPRALSQEEAKAIREHCAVLIDKARFIEM